MGGFAVAIDGPGGAGKSTVARLLAHELGFLYIDTGAMYRAVALYCIENDIPFEQAAIDRCLGMITVHIEHVSGEQRIFLNGADVTGAIRTPTVADGSSKVAVFPAVREKLVAFQRQLARKGSVIMDGRDIGTVVLPFADVKIYLDAGIDQRTRRRQAELSARGIEADFEQTKEEMLQRDYRDSHRECVPLRCAEDAIRVDTSEMDLDAVKSRIMGIILAKMKERK